MDNSIIRCEGTKNKGNSKKMVRIYEKFTEKRGIENRLWELLPPAAEAAGKKAEKFSR